MDPDTGGYGFALLAVRCAIREQQTATATPPDAAPMLANAAE
jgi:hypothetical protein